MSNNDLEEAYNFFSALMPDTQHTSAETNESGLIQPSWQQQSSLSYRFIPPPPPSLLSFSTSRSSSDQSRVPSPTEYSAFMQHSAPATPSGFTAPGLGRSRSHASSAPVPSTSRSASSLLLSKPFKCPRPNCNKSYKQANGLKYHITHGSCNSVLSESSEQIKDLLERKGSDREQLNGADSIEGNSRDLMSNILELELQEAERRMRPFACGIGDCQRRYKNMNGLRYHCQHSGDHGAAGLALLTSGQHECLQKRNHKRSENDGENASEMPSAMSGVSQHLPVRDLKCMTYKDLFERKRRIREQLDKFADDISPGALGRDQDTSELELQEAERRMRPFACGVGDCQRRYKNMNGLRYHYQHSGDHGAAGLALLASGQHECFQERNHKRSENDGGNASEMPSAMSGISRHALAARDASPTFTPGRPKYPWEFSSSYNNNNSWNPSGVNRTHKRRRTSASPGSASDPPSSPASYGSFDKFVPTSLPSYSPPSSLDFPHLPLSSYYPSGRSSPSSMPSYSPPSSLDFPHPPLSNYYPSSRSSPSPHAQFYTFNNGSNSNGATTTLSNWPYPLATSKRHSRPGSAQSGSSGGRSDSP